jgi:hypothetical protein
LLHDGFTSRAGQTVHVLNTARSLPDIELSTLRPEEISLAVGVAASGMRDNPFSVALFGDDPVRRVRGLKATFYCMKDPTVPPMR